MSDQPPLVVITGPTAVGKSALALELAAQFNGEIISADSRQVYIGMDLATAKPSPEELASIPHHLIDIVHPDRDFALPEFQERATATIEDVQSRGKTPFLVGGTVLYINAICEGWEVPRVAPDLEFRQKLEKEAAENGPARLYEELQQLDPEAAAHIIPSNSRRIIRALEVYHQTGRKFSEAQGRKGSPYRLLKLALTLERNYLYQRADERVEAMFRRGLVAEVERLLAEGYSPELPAMSSLGYGQVTAYLRGELSLDEAKARMCFSTHRYIRQQYSWFRRDPALIWLDAGDETYREKARQLVADFLPNTEIAGKVDS